MEAQKLEHGRADRLVSGLTQVAKEIPKGPVESVLFETPLKALGVLAENTARTGVDALAWAMRSTLKLAGKGLKEILLNTPIIGVWTPSR